MQHCEKLMKCPFFNDKMANMPSVADVLKQKFCLGDRSSCARYQVSNAGKAIPADLFPNHQHRVRALLSA